MKDSNAQKIIIALCGLILSACAGVQTNGGPATNETVKDAKPVSPASISSEDWMTRAETLQGSEKNVAILNAVGRLHAKGDWYNARRALEHISAMPSDPVVAMRYRLLSATQYLSEGRNQKAIEILPSISREIPPADLERILMLKGVAQLRNGNTVEGLQSLVHRGNYFPATQETNTTLIWQELVTSSAAANVGYGKEYGSGNQTVNGWLNLFGIVKKQWVSPTAFIPNLQRWAQHNIGHPAANKLVPLLVEIHNGRSQYPEAVAMLLPTSGKYARASEAIRDGFMAAYYEQSPQGYKPVVKIYDTAGDEINLAEQVQQAYAQAVADGAKIVIGPLRKEALAALTEIQLPVPVLALNYLPVQYDEYSIANMLQFGLSPEREAKEVAQRASQDGHSRALVIAPADAWGKRVSDAFVEAFNGYGGVIVGSALYNPRKTDYSKPIRKALLLNDSAKRHDLLERVTGVGMKVEPRRRQDIDFIFMPGQPAQSRILRPQLKFHRAGKVPVYSTSHVYSGLPNRNKNADLNGVKFPDMPWLLDTSDAVARVKSAVSSYGGLVAQKRSRLYALGVDAYRLIPMAKPVPVTVPWYLPGATGDLSLASNGRVKRGLQWAEFRSGEVRRLQEAQ